MKVAKGHFMKSCAIYFWQVFNLLWLSALIPLTLMVYANASGVLL